MVGVLLKIIFDDPPTCFKGEIQRLTPPAKRAFGALFDRQGGGGGRLHLKPPKFEHIFVAVITFSPFLVCKYF